MSDWSDGYVTDVGYIYGYYPELNPNRFRYALTEAGYACPTIKTACELGFGQGISINAHAAASDISWYGTDFNPSQVSFAQDLGTKSGAALRLFEDSFAEFARRQDLPNFDFIGMHGIWSWVDDKNRATIVDFLRRKLNVGGVLYVSYNTVPGWAAMSPLRELLTAYSDTMAAQGQGTLSRIDESLAFVDKLLETAPAFTKAAPEIAATFQELKSRSRNYLAHEYFNRDWVPISFSRMSEWLTPAKLSFACPATLFDHVEVINVTQQQKEFLAGIPDPVFRQMVRDFMLNRRFRKDYWIKGPRHLSVLEQNEALRAQRVAMIAPRRKIALKLRTTMGEVQLQEGVYAPILDKLQSFQPQSLGELEQALGNTSLSFAALREAALILTAADYLSPVQDAHMTSRASDTAQKLNAALMKKARSDGDTNILASAATGGALPVDRISQLFLSALAEGLQGTEQWVQYAWAILSSLGEVLLKEGQRLGTEEENLRELGVRAKEVEERLPIWRALGVI